MLRDFSFYHQPLNQRPRITEVTVGEDGTGRIARGVRPPSPQRPRSPLIKIRWKIETPDEDELSYRVYLRPAKPAAAPPSPVLTTSPGPAASPASSDEGEWLPSRRPRCADPHRAGMEHGSGRRWSLRAQGCGLG